MNITVLTVCVCWHINAIIIRCLSFIGYNQDNSHVHSNIIIYIYSRPSEFILTNKRLIKSRILIYVSVHNLCPPHVIPVV